jgi:hypothetical protein
MVKRNYIFFRNCCIIERDKLTFDSLFCKEHKKVYTDMWDSSDVKTISEGTAVDLNILSKMNVDKSYVKGMSKGLDLTEEQKQWMGA